MTSKHSERPWRDPLAMTFVATVISEVALLVAAVTAGFAAWRRAVRRLPGSSGDQRQQTPLPVAT